MNSANGKTWELVQANVPWKGRRGHTVTVFDDGNGEAMFLIGGFSVNEATGYGQYNSEDHGIRSGHAATADPATGTIYVQGGMHGILFESINNQSQLMSVLTS